MTQTIEQLTARVREIEAEKKELQALLDFDNARLDQIEDELEDVEYIGPYVEGIKVLKTQLATSQLHAEQLRVALEQITKQMFTSYKAKNGRDCYIEDDSGELCYIVPHEPIITAQAALAIPRDTSARCLRCGESEGGDEMSENKHERRVSACVNACAGISTENLEDNLPVKELARRYNKALKQRDELMAALKKLTDVFANIGITSGLYDDEQDALKSACAAIASVEGQK